MQPTDGDVRSVSVQSTGAAQEGTAWIPRWAASLGRVTMMKSMILRAFNILVVIGCVIVAGGAGVRPL